MYEIALHRFIDPPIQSPNTLTLNLSVTLIYEMINAWLLSLCKFYQEPKVKNCCHEQSSSNFSKVAKKCFNVKLGHFLAIEHDLGLWTFDHWTSNVIWLIPIGYLNIVFLVEINATVGIKDNYGVDCYDHAIGNGHIEPANNLAI